MNINVFLDAEEHGNPQEILTSMGMIVKLQKERPIIVSGPPCIINGPMIINIMGQNFHFNT